MENFQAAPSQPPGKRIRRKPLSAAPTVFVRRIGPHHFAHLRAVAEGLDIEENARRYLGIEHGHEARTAHLQTVDAVRSIARRTGEKAWRLIGLAIRPPMLDEKARPNLEDFILDRDLDGWSEADVALMYEEAYPKDQRLDTRVARRLALREKQLELLKRMQALHVERTRPSDAISGWFDDVTAKRLISAGHVTLGELRARIDVGGRWFSTMPGIGRAKAARIEAHLDNLLPPSPAAKTTPAFPVDLLAHRRTDELDVRMNPGQSLVEPIEPLLDSTNGYGLLDACNDIEAVQAWIKLRAGSPATAKSYRKEATRLLLWLKKERDGGSFGGMSVEACGAYIDFLKAIPAHWISRTHAAPGEVGWAPFRGQLSHASQRQAIVIVASLFLWLQSVKYLAGSPWVAVNTKLGDDKNENTLDTKAFSEGAMCEVMRFINAQPPSPARDRIRFIVSFIESVGLRSAELLEAKLGDLRLEPEGWVMQVHGKGSKNRHAIIPPQAFEAIQAYLESRGIRNVQNANADTPLLASVRDPGKHLGYQALYEHVSGWLFKAVNASDLPRNEREKLAGASTHWLRHTFGTRAIAREVPLDVIQAQMGHASIETTTRIYGRAPIRRRVDELGKAFR